MIFSALADKAKNFAADNNDLGAYFAVTAAVVACLGAAEVTADYIAGGQAPEALACLETSAVSTDAKPACPAP